ncbi:MAG: DUF3592 domain-containing protein [Mojavia pulchra JT2-VF2]|jgi:hypothetical protein|uniref:DUF3592 domain-containing protein n=1 Tax=Mojavia pulchra JT2-VF2 TaxID=287848 RepID=A0A951UJT9_9NOST|nr:DUF3592 domain-containing protein [Mojavia pulchra JT2-VF2]
MDDSKFFLTFGSIFAGIGSIFAVTGIMFGINTHSFVGTAVSTQGTVIDLKLHLSTDSKGRSSSFYYPVVKFAPNSGEPIIFESNAGSKPPAFTKGQQVEVLYDPQKPKSAMINSWFELWFLPAMFTGMGSLFVLIGGTVLVKSFPRLVNFK